MLRSYLKDNKIDDFPDKDITKLINDYLNSESDINLKRLTKKLDEIKFVMPVNFVSGKLNSFNLITDANDNNYIPLFTSLEEYEKYEKNVKSNGYIIDTLANLATILLKVNDIYALVIDPLGINITLTREIITDKNTMLYKEYEDERKINEHLSFGNPKNISDELVNNLVEFLTKLNYVKECYIILLNQDEEYRYAIILDMDVNDNIFIFSDIQNEISKYSPFLLQVMIKNYDNIFDDYLKHIKPIYINSSVDK